MNIKHIFLLFALAATVLSCYKDKGNYDYNDSVNDVIVDLKPLYGARKEATTVTIRPTITQTHHEGTDNLRYSWRMSNSYYQNPRPEVGTEDHLSIEIDPTQANFAYSRYIDLYVTDLLTGATQMFPTELRIAKPYQGSWMILHQQDNGPRLGSVEYVGNTMLVTNDAYYKETDTRLSGTGYKLGVHNKYTSPFGNGSVCGFFVFTSDPEQSGMYAQDDKFRLIAPQKMMFPNDYETFDPSAVGDCIRQEGGGIVVSGGKLFQASKYTGTMGSTLPGAQVETDNPETYITHATIGSHIFLAYDALNSRFLTLNTRNNNWRDWALPEISQMGRFNYVLEHAGNVQSVDTKNIGSDKDMVYLGPGYFVGRSISLAGWMRTSMYAFAVGNGSGRSYVYEFHSYPMDYPDDSYDPSPFPNYYVIDTPAGVTSSTLMTSSNEYNRILFYAVDNRVYKLDFATTGGLSTLIYQHPDPAAKITSLKIARGNDDAAYTDEPFPAARTLGVGYDMPDGSGELVVLILNGAGMVEEGTYGDFPCVQRHTTSEDGQKFGPIRDVAYI